MTYLTRDQAKALSTKSDLELYDAAQPPRLTNLTKAELKDLVKRSRELRDKLLDVKRKQIRSKQSKTGQRGTDANARSAEKARLYSEVHDVFVARLAAIEAADAKKKKHEPTELLASAAVSRMSGGAPSRAATRSAKETFASKAAADPSVDAGHQMQAAARTAEVRGKVLDKRIARSGLRQHQSHISATNKRNQSRKDSK